MGNVSILQPLLYAGKLSGDSKSFVQQSCFQVPRWLFGVFYLGSDCKSQVSLSISGWLGTANGLLS